MSAFGFSFIRTGGLLVFILRSKGFILHTGDDIYTKPIDAARMVTYTENDVTYHFVDNQILVFLEDVR